MEIKAEDFTGSEANNGQKGQKDIGTVLASQSGVEIVSKTKILTTPND